MGKPLPVHGLPREVMSENQIASLIEVLGLTQILNVQSGLQSTLAVGPLPPNQLPGVPARHSRIEVPSLVQSAPAGVQQ